MIVSGTRRSLVLVTVRSMIRPSMSTGPEQASTFRLPHAGMQHGFDNMYWQKFGKISGTHFIEIGLKNPRSLSDYSNFFSDRGKLEKITGGI